MTHLKTMLSLLSLLSMAMLTPSANASQHPNVVKSIAACRMVFDDIGAKLSDRDQTVTSQEISWAVKAEFALEKGRPCPTLNFPWSKNLTPLTKSISADIDLRPSLCRVEKNHKACWSLYNAQSSKWDLAKGIIWAEAGCEAGNKMLCAKAAIGFARGAPGLNINNRKAFIYNSRACDMGHLNACASKGNSYRYGKGVRKDWDMALKIYDQTCASGLRIACQYAVKDRAYFASLSNRPVPAPLLSLSTMDQDTVARAMQQGQSNRALEGCRLIRLPNYKDRYDCSERDSNRMRR